MSNLTTHVLDTSQGKPAEGMKVQLFKIEDKKSVQLAEVITNKDGRVDQKLLKSENNIGIYELRFFAGDYFNKENLQLTKIKFLDEITIRFDESLLSPSRRKLGGKTQRSPTRVPRFRGWSINTVSISKLLFEA